MQSAALFSQPCAARQRPHGSLSTMDNSVRSFVRHSDVPSVPTQHGAEGMGDTSSTRDRNLSILRDKTEKSAQDLFSKHVTEPPKVVALKLAKAGAPISPHTVKSHQQRLPDTVDTFLAYCRAYPGFAVDALELMGIDLDLHRDSYAQYLELQKRIRGQ